MNSIIQFYSIFTTIQKLSHPKPLVISVKIVVSFCVWLYMIFVMCNATMSCMPVNTANCSQANSIHTPSIYYISIDACATTNRPRTLGVKVWRRSILCISCQPSCHGHAQSSPEPSSATAPAMFSLPIHLLGQRPQWTKMHICT